MSKIDTKLIWSVTPFGLEKQTIPFVGNILNQNGISLIRATYSKYAEKTLKSLKNYLQKSSHNSDPTFIFEFVGRRCLICVPNEHFVFVDNAILDLEFSVDFEFCAMHRIAPSQNSTIEMKVSSGDQLKSLKKGSILNISYGSVRLEITHIVSRKKNTLLVKCKVLEGGSIFSGLKVHSVDIPKQLLPLLPEDKNSLKKKLNGQADYLVVSGLKSEKELISLKKLLLGKTLKSSHRHPSVPITANILNINTLLPPRILFKVGSRYSHALMPKILPLVDGIFLSRSELGIDEHPHQLGIFQKEIIASCNQQAKAIIVSSELMQSMRQNPTPTRAEVSDMANAMEDGADALVLSSEVTHGVNSHLVAQISREVLAETEAWKAKEWKPFELTNLMLDDDVVIEGALRIAEQADVTAIVCFTEGGYTAYKLSAMRTPKSIIAITCNKRIYRQLALLHAVQPVLLDEKPRTEKLLTDIKNILIEKFNFKHGDKFVFVSLTASSISARHSNLFTLQTLE